MSHDLISKKIRYEFREYFVGTTLREIETGRKERPGLIVCNCQSYDLISLTARSCRKSFVRDLKTVGSSDLARQPRNPKHMLTLLRNERGPLRESDNAR